jgi:hypothetical protein
LSLDAVDLVVVVAVIVEIDSDTAVVVEVDFDEVTDDISDPLGDVDSIGDRLACFISSAEIIVMTNGGFFLLEFELSIGRYFEFEDFFDDKFSYGVSKNFFRCFTVVVAVDDDCIKRFEPSRNRTSIGGFGGFSFVICR